MFLPNGSNPPLRKMHDSILIRFKEMGLVSYMYVASVEGDECHEFISRFIWGRWDAYCECAWFWKRCNCAFALVLRMVSLDGCPMFFFTVEGRCW